MTDRGDDNISLESSDVAASHIGTLIATPDNDEQSCAVSNEIPMTPLNKNTQDVSNIMRSKTYQKITNKFHLKLKFKGTKKHTFT